MDQISSDIDGRPSRRRDPRQHFGLMAAVHFCAVVGVAVVGYLLAHSALVH